MPYTISSLRDDLSGLIHGAELNKVTNLTNLINRAAREVLLEVDPMETKRTQQITNAIHDQVYDYTLPTDLKGNRIIDIRPQANREENENLGQSYDKRFDMFKSKTSDEYNINYNNFVKTVRISTNPQGSRRAVLHTMDSLTANGTWAATAPATNLTADTLDYISGSASLNFDLNAGANPSTGFIENSTMTAVDLTDYQNIATLFTWVYIPDTTIITSFNLRWGSSDAAYWNRTITAPFTFTTFSNGWNLLGFNWDGATQVGAPIVSATDYLRFSVTYNGTAETDIRVDNILASVGSIHEIKYYSAFPFRNAAGTFIEETTANTDLVNLENHTVALILYRLGYLAAQQIQGEDARFDIEVLGKEYERLLGQYKRQYKSEVAQPRTFYHSVSRPSYNKTIGE